MVINAAVSAANSTPACPPLTPGHHATPNYVTNCSAGVQQGLCGHWSLKQHLQCTKLHCRRRQLLRCGLRALMALNSMTALRANFQQCRYHIAGLVLRSVKIHGTHSSVYATQRENFYATQHNRENSLFMIRSVKIWLYMADGDT